MQDLESLFSFTPFFQKLIDSKREERAQLIYELKYPSILKAYTKDLDLYQIFEEYLSQLLLKTLSISKLKKYFKEDDLKRWLYKARLLCGEQLQDATKVLSESQIKALHDRREITILKYANSPYLLQQDSPLLQSNFF